MRVHSISKGTLLRQGRNYTHARAGTLYNIEDDDCDHVLAGAVLALFE